MTVEAPPATVTIEVDGREIAVRPDRPVLRGALEAGIEIPHFCYHPGLSIAGNCRMCLVGAEGMPGLQISCSLFPREGMKIVTASDEVREARATVMELLLINHPLDCPVCDQSGECWLQDYAFQHGRDKGRFEEQKVRKPKKNVGPRIALWAERCISCTRCVRFLEEVSGTGELSIVNRGDQSYADICPGVEVDNPLAGNVVDVCPVGALCDRDFLYQARVWWLKSTPSICSECARGCSVHVDAAEGRVQRVRPRTNEAVNGFWICDIGRDGHKPLRDGRLLAHRVAGREVALAEALDAAARALREAPAVAGVGSLWMTCEELQLLSELLERLGGQAAGFLARPLAERLEFPGFVISGDRNPNRAGVERLFGEGAAVEPDPGALPAGALLVACAIPGYEPSPELLAALAGRPVVLLHTHAGALADAASVVLAGSCPLESDGSAINEDGLLQELRTSVAPPGAAEPGFMLLQRLQDALAGEANSPLSARAIRQRAGLER